MALDFHIATDPRDAKPVLSLADSALPLLQGVFHRFESKTGVCIDWYGTTRLTRGHCVGGCLKARDSGGLRGGDDLGDQSHRYRDNGLRAVEAEAA